jgi:hypothetical protein
MKATNRKSRLLRVSASQFSFSYKYKPLDKEWIALEAALQNTIPSHVHQSIVKVIQSYFDLAPAEIGAPFINDVQRFTAKIRSAALGLEQSFGGAVGDDHKKALSLAKVRISIAFKDATKNKGATKKLYGTPYDAFRRELSRFIHATNVARQKNQADEKSGFQEGDSWKRMVRDLRKLFKENGLPATAAQGIDKSNSNRGSDFVEFFHALQKTFPAELRRHHLGNIFSLAKEINRASAFSGQ